MRIVTLFLTLLTIIGRSLTSPLPPGELSGKVVGVADGDTITILVDRMPIKLRLAGIDCPEKQQPFYSAAKKFTSERVFGKIVIARVISTDRYGRSIAEVRTPVGQLLNADLVEHGLCWWYEHYDPKNERLKSLEQKARRKQVGVFQDVAPTPPWEFRKMRKNRAEPIGQVD